MEAQLHHFLEAITQFHSLGIVGVIGVLLLALGKAADVLVDEAVILADRAEIPKVIIGATIVSLGTTTPEAAISVLAAIKGDPGLALGNAVGSIICDTGLILGIAAMMAPLPLDKSVVNRQGWIQLGAGVLLVACCFVFGDRLPRTIGFFFLALLALYIWMSIGWAKKQRGKKKKTAHENEGYALVVAKLIAAVVAVVAVSHVLIPAVEIAAKHAGIPEHIIAATLVAFGTSLPELVTAVSAVRKGQGELAIGNVIGADILNVLFVVGAACAVTSEGLGIPPNFFKLHFPFMLGVLVFFRVGIFLSKDKLSRPFGVLLFGSYLSYLATQYMVLGSLKG
ncbi:MAG: sodium:calcium antiporter [Elusimicrobia bacterium]|nr:MAG: sodium:calcium antiporter [Elusimicrobiota bacterium]